VSPPAAPPPPTVPSRERPGESSAPDLPTQITPKITISYRRADCGHIAGRIWDKLVQHFGRNSVFMDIDSVTFGVDYRDHINTELASTDVLLAIIGPAWRGSAEDGRVRIEDESDLVRIEVETALRRGIPVVPVLIDGAPIPKSDQLPESLRSLAFRNAAPVDSGVNFHNDTERLIRSIDQYLRSRRKAAQPS
jgi:TIR domain